MKGLKIVGGLIATGLALYFLKKNKKKILTSLEWEHDHNEKPLGPVELYYNDDGIQGSITLNRDVSDSEKTDETASKKRSDRLNKSHITIRKDLFMTILFCGGAYVYANGKRKGIKKTIAKVEPFIGALKSENRFLTRLLLEETHKREIAEKLLDSGYKT